MSTSPYSDSYFCGSCAQWFPGEHLRALRVVWLRSRHISYTAELPKNQLGPKGEIRDRPDLAGFVWERWP